MKSAEPKAKMDTINHSDTSKSTQGVLSSKEQLSRAAAVHLALAHDHCESIGSGHAGEAMEQVHRLKDDPSFSFEIVALADRLADWLDREFGKTFCEINSEPQYCFPLVEPTRHRLHTLKRPAWKVLKWIDWQIGS